MDYYIISALLNFLTSIALGIIIILRNPKKSVNLSFTFFTFSVALWSLCYAAWQLASSESSALFWLKALMSFAIFIPVFYIHFILSFLEITKNKQTFIRLSYILFTGYVLLNIFTSSIVSDTKNILGFDYWPVPGLLFHPLLLTWMAYVIYTTSILYKAFTTSNGSRRSQIRYLLLGMVVGFGGGMTNYFLWYSIPVLPFGNLLVSVYVGSTAYAIAKHRLLDIRLVVARTLAYSMLLSIITLFYTVSLFTFTTYFYQESISGGRIVVSTILTLIVALTFQPLRKFLEKVTDKIFFKGAYDSNKLLNSLSRIMAMNIHLQQLTQGLLDELLSQMRISRGVFILTEAGKIFDIQSHGMKDYKAFNNVDVLSLMDQDKMLVFEELEEGKVKDLMRKLDITVAAPLKTGNEEIGILFLGEKLSGDIYSDQDLKLLDILIPEASVAIQNAKSYEEIRRFNITLREEVNKATKEVKEANFKLQELDKLKDEFISITSHDLRTPMTAIKYYLWLILHGKKMDKTKMNLYLQRSYTSSERMITLINDLLNVSRIESGKIKLDLVPIKLEEMIDEIKDEVMSKATEKGINLTFTHPSERLPMSLVDEERFPEILTNLLGNAIKFTKQGGNVTIEAKLAGPMVEISVADNGVGIKKEDMPKLFTKFGRLDSSYVAAATNGGTGLGLYITKNLVELHGGRIWVDSVEGKGAKFTFTVRPATKEDMMKKHEDLVPSEGVYFAPPT